MAKNPPSVTDIFGAPPAKNKGSAWQQFVNHWAKQYPALKRNAPDIEAAAQEAHIDPIYFASVLLTESGADYNTKPSSAGAIGIGQIMPNHVGDTVPWDPTQTVTLQDIRSPSFNLRYSAYFLASQIGQHGYAHAYDQGYNPGYTGPGPQQFISKWSGQYVAKTPSTAPPSPVGQQAPGGTAPSAPDIRNPYVTVRGGRIVTVTDPNKSLKYFGAPVTLSQFKQLSVDYSQHFVAYTGKPPTALQVAQLIQHPVSTYALQLRLANSPAFVKSPIYKQAAPNYISVWHSIYGPSAQPDRKAIVAAAARGLDQTAFADQLRQRPDYTKSEEYKQNFAQMSSAYQKIYGVPDDNANSVIGNVTKQGWSADQFATWLRDQPAYKGSEEYKAKALSFAQQMGLITGQMPTLTFQQAELGGAPAAPAPPAPPPAPNQNNQQPSLPVAQPPQGEPKNQPPFTRKVA